jgi:hypothetical protein
MDNKDIEVNEYLKSLNEQELKTLNIAIDQLGTSLNIKKSIGYIKWKKSKNTSL